MLKKHRKSTKSALRSMIATARPIVSGAFIFLSFYSISSQTREPVPSRTPERSREIVSLLNDARLAAPELAADTFLKVLESKKVVDSTWRKEILDEALRIADDAKNPVRLRSIQIRGVVLNNTEGAVTSSAHSLKLDRLSLKARIITLLLESDIERAKQIIFDMGGQLRLKPRSCSDDLTYEVADIYVAVAKVAKSFFTEKQIAEGQRALFIAPWLENIESPTQISPALGLLEQMQGSSAEKQLLFSALSKAIARNFNDDRSFTNALNWHPSPVSRIEKLVTGEIDPLKTELKQAYRTFLLKNLNASRCVDNEIKKGDTLPKFVETANKLFPEKPLAVDDLVASELVATGKFVDVLARSDSIQKLKNDLTSLKGKIVDNKRVIDSGPEWESRVIEFIDRVLSWESRNNETDSETLFVKAAMFGGMLESIDDLELKKSVLRKYLRYLDGSLTQNKNFVEWLSFLDLARGKNEPLFVELAPEFPNPNFKVLLATKQFLNRTVRKDELETIQPSKGH